MTQLNSSSKILFKRSKTSGKRPEAADILPGELFVNLADKSILTSDGTNVIELGSKLTDGYLPLSGGTLKGPLTAPKVLVSEAQATEANSLTRKDYVDKSIDALNKSTSELANTKVAKSGDTMTGNLTAPKVLLSSAQGSEANALTRKDYVDTKVAKTGDLMTGRLDNDHGFSVADYGSREANGIFRGNGDGAAFDKCNVDIKSWYGVSFGSPAQDAGRTIVINTRVGSVAAKGRYQIEREEFVGHEVKATGGQFRAISGKYGFMLRNDGSNTYFLFTKPDDPYGSWDGIQPFTINNATRDITMGSNLNIGGTGKGIVINGLTPGSGSYAAQHDPAAKAGLFNEIDSASASMYSPLIKQRYKQGALTWSQGTLVNAGNWIIHLRTGAGVDRQWQFQKDGTTRIPGSIYVGGSTIATDGNINLAVANNGFQAGWLLQQINTRLTTAQNTANTAVNTANGKWTYNQGTIDARVTAVGDPRYALKSQLPAVTYNRKVGEIGQYFTGWFMAQDTYLNNDYAASANYPLTVTGLDGLTSKHPTNLTSGRYKRLSDGAARGVAFYVRVA